LAESFFFSSRFFGLLQELQPAISSPTCRTASRSILLTSVDAFDAPDSRASTSIWGNHNPATQSPHSRPIRGHHERRIRIKGTGMTEQQNVLAAEREEIATRVASFKATQEKFQREREEYFAATLQKPAADSNACHSGPADSTAL
jgi:chorismate mutase